MVSFSDFDEIVDGLKLAHAAQIKDKVVQEIVDRIFADFKAQAEKLVRAEAEKLVNISIDRWVDLAHMADHVVITHKWKSE